MVWSEDESCWPPSDLAAYYRSPGFLKRTRSLKRLLERNYSNIDAEVLLYDVVADSIVKELKNQEAGRLCLAKFPTEKRYFAYLRKACTNRIIDGARSFQGKFRQLLEEDDVEDPRLGPSESALERELDWQKGQMVGEINRAVKKMPKIQQIVFMRRVTENKTFAEISKTLQISKSQAFRLFENAVRELSKHLDAKDYGRET